MKFIITGKNIEVTAGLRSAVEEKIGKLDKYFNDEVTANVTLSVEKERQKIEVTIPIKGNIIRAEEVSNDMYVSIDLVEEIIERQMRRYKTRLVNAKQAAAEFSKTYIEEIGAGDFLFIQFGHNDEKKEDPTRYTEPFSTFMENLEIFINVARKHGAYPVLITPLERRCFVDDKHLGIGAHSDYVAAMKQTAEKCNVPLADLYSMSRTELKKAGEMGSRKWFMYFSKGEYKNYPDGKTDNTHLRYDGAVLFAGLIAKGLQEAGGVYADLLVEEETLNEKEIGYRTEKG